MARPPAATVGGAAGGWAGAAAAPVPGVALGVGEQPNAPTITRASNTERPAATVDLRSSGGWVKTRAALYCTSDSLLPIGPFSSQTGLSAYRVTSLGPP